jgi:hypothetical protein
LSGAEVNIQRCTITSSFDVDLVALTNTTLHLSNNIMVNVDSPIHIVPEGTGIVIQSEGYNFFSASSFPNSVATDQFNQTFTTLQLGDLQNNGGFTFTRALGTGSTAINAADPSFTCTGCFDQRGSPFSRVNQRLDAGAFELTPAAPTPSRTRTRTRTRTKTRTRSPSRSPKCGNGVVEPDEQCDPANAQGADKNCCTSACKFASSGKTCAPAQAPCLNARQCNAQGKCRAAVVKTTCTFTFANGSTAPGQCTKDNKCILV